MLHLRKDSFTTHLLAILSCFIKTYTLPPGVLPPPPPTQVRWRFHTMGGRCIYCGETCSGDDPRHFEACQKYKKARLEEDEGGSSQESVPQAMRKDKNDTPKEHTTPPNATTMTNTTAAAQLPPSRVSLSGTKRPANNSTSTSFCNNPRTSTPAVRQPNLSLGNGPARVTPPPTEARQYKSPCNNTTTAEISGAPSSSLKKNEFLVCCLTCGTEGCRYENGYTVLREEDDGEVEFDPDEPKPPTCEEWSTSCASSFDTIKQPIKTVVAGLMGSSGFWSSHKYIASPQLDLKLKTWMKRRLFNNVVDEHFCFLRRAAKETLRYKRHLSVKAIRNAFFGTNPPFKFRRVLGFFFQATNHPPCFCLLLLLLC